MQKMGKEIAVLEMREGAPRIAGAEKRIGTTPKEKNQGFEEQVSDLFGKLNLTAKENETLVLEDLEESDLAVVNHAVIGKVLAPSSLHLQTIMSAMRPAWGNPRGLEARMVGDNLFIAEFESEHDKNRALEGSPWFIGRQSVGRNAVILQEFNYDLRPSDVKFDEMAIWINILNLPFGLRNEKWGFELAGKIGKQVLKVDVDEQKRAVGKELRARVIISLKEPLCRGVSVVSSRRQRREWYDVVYEKVPYFCFSCGIIGHSEIECPTPALRDDKGCLPYNEKLRAPDERKMKNQGEWHTQGDSSSRRSNSAGVRGSADSKKSETNKSDDSKKDGMEGRVDAATIEAFSPLRNQVSKVGLPPDDFQSTIHSKKRKPDERVFQNNLDDNEDNTIEVYEDLPMALMPIMLGDNNSQERLGESELSDASKKMKKENAGLLEQPRVQN